MCVVRVARGFNMLFDIHAVVVVFVLVRRYEWTAVIFGPTLLM